MSDATQLQYQGTRVRSEGFDRIAAYRLRVAALERHLIREQIAKADRVLVSGQRASLTTNGLGDADAAMVALPVRPSFNSAPGDSPLLYKTAGIRSLIADVTRWVVRVARGAVDGR